LIKTLAKSHNIHAPTVSLFPKYSGGVAACGDGGSAPQNTASHTLTGKVKHLSRRIISHKGLPGLGKNTFGTVARMIEPS